MLEQAGATVELLLNYPLHQPWNIDFDLRGDLRRQHAVLDLLEEGQVQRPVSILALLDFEYLVVFGLEPLLHPLIHLPFLLLFRLLLQCLYLHPLRRRPASLRPALLLGLPRLTLLAPCLLLAVMG